MKRKDRLDSEVYARGMAQSREAARRLIMAHQVFVDGKIATKPGVLVPCDAEISVATPPRFVSRGGDKLEHALREFAIVVEQQPAADIGASTGGFSDCLLQHGARSVVAVDTGAGQMHARIRDDARVTLHENCNARHLTADALRAPDGAAPTVLAMDVSFISARLILPALHACAAAGAQLVVLVKPQFEAGRADVSRGRGVIRDAEIHRRVLTEVLGACPALGWSPRDVIPSPIVGGSGNREFLALLLRLDAPVPAESGNIIPDALLQRIQAAAEPAPVAPPISGDDTTNH